MKTLAAFAAVLVSSASSALASGGVCLPGVQCSTVPEISAVSGLAAVAALAAGIAIVRERMSR